MTNAYLLSLTVQASILFSGREVTGKKKRKSKKYKYSVK